MSSSFLRRRVPINRNCRYSKTFTTIEPTLFNVCEYWFKKDQTRIRDIRIDALSQMLNMANIRPGGRYIAVDDASGLIVSGILERMGGKASAFRLIRIHGFQAWAVLSQSAIPTLPRHIRSWSP